MLSQTLSRFGIQTTGYRPKSPTTDLMLGAVKGVDYILWGYTFAALIFTGSLSGYLPYAVSIVLLSGAIIAIGVALTTTYPINVAGVEEQAVAILSTISVLISTRMDEFAGVDAAAATMFTIMGLTALLFGISLRLTARFNLSQLIQLMPFPVVCGFLAGTGWLFLSAGITMMADIEVDVFDPHPLFQMEALIHWLPALACGLAAYVILSIKHHFMTLPLVLVACAAGFYTIAWWLGLSPEALREGGWMFHMDMAEGGAKGLGTLDFAHVNFSFIASVMPEIATIVLISMMTASFSLSAVELGTGASLDMNKELRGLGTANLLSASCLGLPGLVEVAPSVMYSRMGACSRLLPLLCGFVLLAAAFLGGNFIEHIPRIVMGALVFMVGIQFVHEWLFVVGKQMQRDDRFTVVLIFGVIVMAGFIPGVLLGIILTSLLFIVRISKIDVVGSSFLLNQLASSVERSAPERELLQEYGRDIRIFNLRGFLFFGSANAFFDRIKEICEQDHGYTYFVFNFRRVIGIDSTAVQVFIKINNLLESRNIEPVFCGLGEHVLPAFKVAGVFEASKATVLSDLDLALKWGEERLLARRSKQHGEHGVIAILGEILGDSEKAMNLAESMERLSLSPGEYLFRQGDAGTAIYVIESGVVEVQLESASGKTLRLRELRRGALIGEMAFYSTARKRSASAIVTEAAVLYKLEPELLDVFGERAVEYQALLHEMVARLLASRLLVTNQRTAADL